MVPNAGEQGGEASREDGEVTTGDTLRTDKLVMV